MSGEINIKLERKKIYPSPIIIVGMGKSGQAAFDLLLELGYTRKELICLDEIQEGFDYKDSTSLLKKIQPATLVVSPGVDISKDWIAKSKQENTIITSELSLAASFLKEEKVIGVTGSLGKSTIVALLGASLKTTAYSHFIGANFGMPLSRYILEKSTVDWLILELSSFQLENCHALKCDSSIITYFTENHLDRYNSIAEYYNTKLKIINYTNKATFALKPGGDLYEYTKNKIPKNKIHWVEKKAKLLSKEDLKKINTLDEYREKNLSLVASLAEFYNWPKEYKTGMLSFTGLPHRLELVEEKNGVLFVNDSKATNISSIEYAAKTLSKRNLKKIWLLLGGQNKNLPWNKLNLPKDKNIVPIFFGQDGEIIKKISSSKGASYKTLKEALNKLPELYKEKEAVLLSPGGASLDEFKNFEERGNFFKRWVNEH